MTGSWLRKKTKAAADSRYKMISKLNNLLSALFVFKGTCELRKRCHAKNPKNSHDFQNAGMPTAIIGHADARSWNLMEPLKLGLFLIGHVEPGL